MRGRTQLHSVDPLPAASPFCPIVGVDLRMNTAASVPRRAIVVCVLHGFSFEERMLPLEPLIPLSDVRQILDKSDAT
jgi:hypothetical protein